MIHMKRCPASLIIRGMQVQITVSDHLAPIKVASIKNKDSNKCCERVKKLEPCVLLVRI